jgi:hypothetical protein
MVTILELAELEAMIEDESNKQEAILLARKYFEGDQVVYLTARAMEFLGIHENNTFRANICRTIVTALASKLNLLGFATDEEGESRPVSEWAAGIYARNKLDSLQDTIHESALADSESFVLVEWDPIDLYPRLIHHPRFIDTNVGGDGEGVFFVYENGDPNQRPKVAVKQWIETTFTEFNTPYTVTRRTLYYPDHIERWVFDAGSWQHFQDDTSEWNIPQRDKSGNPLGIPVFHFKNKGIRPEHWDGIPMQDATNKQFVDALAAGDLTAFQSFFGFGFYPTIDGKAPDDKGLNLMKMGPAQFNGTMKPASEASLQVIPGADVTPIFSGLKDIILLAAQLTETPVSRFVITAAIASADTIKAQEIQLKNKAADRRGLFSDPWVGALDMARKLSNLHGGAGLSEDVSFSPVWEHTETLEELAEKKETLEIPIEQLWKEAGYTEKQIQSMKAEPSYRLKFEAMLWEGAEAASLQGIPLELYLKRAGLQEDEIKEITEAIENQEGIPSVDL